MHRAPVHVTDGDFEAQVLSEPGPVLLDCWAPWCGPCRSVAPILDELASAYAGRVKIAKLNVDENPVTASRFGIQSIPTMLFFKGGRLMQKLVGAVPRQEIEANLRAIM
ncbi:MAG: thioredoxin [Deltaproteobacteria bacterium]|nr:MAG: thioredoxin [Deltaproteobacteria bacterium]